ncbi:flagellar biosynthetic protein FliO [Guyparkeria halophila]|uniref:Flagellar protein n=2 Tax=Guyparkeria halophila TaxID=47960 RepID=A0A6I6D2N1_9GAMM|nr:flagellar biosynthetic protein FliO [Guyparkeria halophila]
MVMRVIPFLIPFLISFLLAGPARAAEAIDPLAPSYLVKLVISLILVLVLMFALVWVVKRVGRLDARAGNYPMQVLTQMSIGPRERILLVAVGDRQMLVGVSQGAIESLGWVDPPLEPRRRDGENPSFGEAFQAQLAARFGKGDQGGKGNSNDG